MTAKITFYGGAGTVTGSNFLLEAGGKKILVDCGTNERETICDPANHSPFAYSAKDVDALLITHAHQDHIGRVPKLLREGFRGEIFSTAATKDLSAVMFDDAIAVMDREAKRLRCDPIYSTEDAHKALGLWKTHEYHETFKIGELSVEFLDAGHILGSAMIRISLRDRTVVFTGDLGNSPEPLLNDTETPAGANYLVMESVYGDRLHEDKAERAQVLRGAIEDARSRNGTLLIPSFSVERTQIILFEIHRMISAGELKPIPIYLDAPLAERVTEVFRKHKTYLNAEAQAEFARGDIFTFPKLTVARDHTGAVDKAPDPKVIIAGAGMSSGGRIRIHEKKYLGDQNASFLLTGYQAPGSLGRRLQDGQKEVMIDGEHIKVRATISALTGYSGHKDRDELLQFVEQTGESLEKVFVVMGEPKASNFLAQRVKDFLGVATVVPQKGETVGIDF